MNRLLSLLLSGFIASVCHGFVEAEDGLLQTLKRCKLHAALASPESAFAIVQSYPLGAQDIQIPVSGQTLLQTVANVDPLGRSLEIRRNALVREQSQASDDRSRLPFFLSEFSDSDGVVIGRGNRIIAFPRFLLLHPIVQNVRVMPGDFVATIRTRYARDTAEGQTARAEDRLWSFLFKYPEQETAPTISIQLPNSKPGSSEALNQDIVRRRGTFTRLTANESHLYSPESSEIRNQRVFLIKRLRDQVEIHYVLPFESSGALGARGQLFQLALEQEVSNPAGPWLEQIQGFGELKFRDGDQLIATRLRSVF